MGEYKIEAERFGLSDTAIHLLRNRYNYETIDFSSIETITITEGRQVKNWLLVLALGIFLLSFGAFYAYRVIYEFFIAGNSHRFFRAHVLLPFFPLVLGPYSIYSALKIVPVLKVVVNNKTRKLPIDGLLDSATVDDVKVFFEQNSLTSNKIQSID
jgi:hypothetical protein